MNTWISEYQLQKMMAQIREIVVHVVREELERHREIQLYGRERGKVNEFQP